MANWKFLVTRSVLVRKYRLYIVLISLVSIILGSICPPVLKHKKREDAYSESTQHLLRTENSRSTQQLSDITQHSSDLEISLFQSFEKEPSIEIFVLPSSKGSLAVVKPLCYYRGNWILIGDSSINIHHSSPKQTVNKKVALETLLRESKLPNISFYSKQWLEQESFEGSITWFKRYAVFQLFDRSCTNIAHFAGRLMLYFHFLQNTKVYCSTMSFKSLFIRESELVQNLLTKSYRNHRKWQKHLIRTVLYDKSFQEDLFDYPSKYTFSTNLRYIGNKEREFYVEDSSDFLREAEKPICFENVVLLGLLKGKFFSPPLGQTSFINTSSKGKTTAPTIPKGKQTLTHSMNTHSASDAISFRNNWYRHWHIKPPSELQRSLIYIKREGKRRSFSSSSEITLNRFLQNLTSQHRFSYLSITPDQLLVKENLQVFSSTSIVISLHGAHLANCIFMAPCAVLIEIFPPRFTHDMYREGGNSGLKYFSWQLRNVTPFSESPCMSPETCKGLDEKRKVFYRDRANLSITQEDLQGLANIVEKSISYIASIRSEYRTLCLRDSSNSL
ncbi:hypothetical protein GpartN1_g546.t1 [Galdieria partita]|uniref:Glycosyltransferase 61 catalytic domain-containing protein n=1 Tax=Galdieria partita TaxID=83374 RepID=A0A9C7UMG7_9RHOD|nr:hypothetical protein GpartN1_g546.t1 [Galdieria partita]